MYFWLPHQNFLFPKYISLLIKSVSNFLTINNIPTILTSFFSLFPLSTINITRICVFTIHKFLPTWKQSHQVKWIWNWISNIPINFQLTFSYINPYLYLTCFIILPIYFRLQYFSVLHISIFLLILITGYLHLTISFFSKKTIMILFLNTPPMLLSLCTNYTSTSAKNSYHYITKFLLEKNLMSCMDSKPLMLPIDH